MVMMDGGDGKRDSVRSGLSYIPARFSPTRKALLANTIRSLPRGASLFQSQAGSRPRHNSSASSLTINTAKPSLSRDTSDILITQSWQRRRKGCVDGGQTAIIQDSTSRGSSASSSHSQRPVHKDDEGTGALNVTNPPQPAGALD